MFNLPILGTAQVSQMFSIPVRRLTAFADLQIVDHHDQRPGTGTTRRYSIANLMMTKLAWNLQALGVAPKKLSRKAELLNHGIARFLNEPNPSRYMSLCGFRCGNKSVMAHQHHFHVSNVHFN